MINYLLQSDWSNGVPTLPREPAVSLDGISLEDRIKDIGKCIQQEGAQPKEALELAKRCWQVATNQKDSKLTAIVLEDGAVKLLTEGQMACLYIQSDYFKQIIDGSFIESRNKIIKLNDIKKEEFENLLNDLFSQEIPNTQLANNILILCNRFGMRHLPSEQIILNLDLENILTFVSQGIDSLPQDFRNALSQKIIEEYFEAHDEVLKKNA